MVLSAVSLTPAASTQLTLDFCRRLDSIVGPQLTVLASDICEQFNINKRISGFVLCFTFTLVDQLLVVRLRCLVLKRVDSVNHCGISSKSRELGLLCMCPRKGKGRSRSDVHFTSQKRLVQLDVAFIGDSAKSYTVSCSRMARHCTRSTRHSQHWT